MVDLTHYNVVKELGGAKNTVNQALITTATTAELTDKTSSINTSGKFLGKQVQNSTTGILVCAAGTGAVGTWKNASTGVVAHTPA
jgi:hypothetical protein